MGRTQPEIPFTEIVERVDQIARVGDNARYKAREAVNSLYVHEIPYKYDWTFLIASSSLTTEKEYKTGTASVTTGGTAVTLSSDAVMSASMVGRKIKFASNDVVYTIQTYTSATSIGLLETFQGDSNIASGSYSIFQAQYALAPDFDRFPKDGGVFIWSGGKKQIIKEEHYHDATTNFQASPTAIPDKVRLVGSNTLGTQLIEFRPAPNSAKIIGYDYLKRLNPMWDSTGGTIIVNNGINTVTGTSTKFTECTTGSWFRVNGDGEGADSRWYRVNTITHDSSLTLSETYKGSSQSGVAYSLSQSPEYPIRMQPALIAGAVRNLTTDQNDPTMQLYQVKYAEVLSDGKRLYVNRNYSTEFHTIAEEHEYRR